MKSVVQWCTSVVDKFGVGPLLRPAVRCIREQRNYLARIPLLISRRSTIENYFGHNSLRKLHLGAADKKFGRNMPTVPGMIAVEIYGRVTARSHV